MLNTKKWDNDTEDLKIQFEVLPSDIPDYMYSVLVQPKNLTNNFIAGDVFQDDIIINQIQMKLVDNDDVEVLLEMLAGLVMSGIKARQTFNTAITDEEIILEEARKKYREKY